MSRRRRRLKTDRTDAESLLRVFMAWHRGERQACSVVRVPSPEDEDMKRLHRSRANLLRERVRHVNRIRGLLHLQGVVHVHPHREGWAAALPGLQTRDGRRFPAQLMAEIRREAKLLELVKKLLREVDLELVALVRAKHLRTRARQQREAHPIASKLVSIRGIGPTLAAVLATELFYRRFDNRRQVASYTGLSPTPYSSGGTSRDQGISKAGNHRARSNAVELAWLWLRHQPDSPVGGLVPRPGHERQGAPEAHRDRGFGAQAGGGPVAVCRDGTGSRRRGVEGLSGVEASLEAWT